MLTCTFAESIPLTIVYFPFECINDFYFVGKNSANKSDSQSVYFFLAFSFYSYVQIQTIHCIFFHIYASNFFYDRTDIHFLCCQIFDFYFFVAYLNRGRKKKQNSVESLCLKFKKKVTDKASFNFIKR